MLTVVIFFVVLSVLILAHEFGHFWLAKRAGAKVEEFGLGFPPRLIKWRRGETLYSINLILFGGFVKIFGEDAADIKEPGSFGLLSISKRAQVIAAGVIMNFILAAVLIMIVAGLGRPTIINESNKALARDISIYILDVSAGSPAETSGLKVGDKIVGYTTVEDFQRFIEENRGKKINLSVERGGEPRILQLTPRRDIPEGEGPLGISLAQVGIVSSPWWRAPWDGLVSAVNLTIAIAVAIVQLLAGVVTGQSVVANLAGPVGIASLTGEAARLGIVYLLQFTALLSINLAILNILPFPALDGGRLVFLLYEKFRGRPANKEFEHAVNMVGFALLILLLVWVTWQDIVRIF